MLNVPAFQSTWHQNRARNASEARYPGLWKGVIGNWQPGLGPTGLTLHDLSGRGNNGVVTDMDPETDWVQSDGRWALNFVPSVAYVDVGLIDLSSMPELSTSIWLRWNGQDDVGSEDAFIDNWVNVGGTATILLRMEPAGDFLEVIVRAAGSEVGGDFGDIAITDTNWHHIVMTYSVNDALRVYLDGQESSTSFAADGILAATPSSNPYLIGADPRGGDNFSGSLDDHILYDRKLHAAEARLLYQLGRGGWLAKRRRVFVKAPAAPTGGILVHPGMTGGIPVLTGGMRG